MSTAVDIAANKKVVVLHNHYCILIMSKYGHLVFCLSFTPSTCHIRCYYPTDETDMVLLVRTSNPPPNSHVFFSKLHGWMFLAGWISIRHYFVSLRGCTGIRLNDGNNSEPPLGKPPRSTGRVVGSIPCAAWTVS